MALIRWEPLGELSSIQNEMNRLFNTFVEGRPGNVAGSAHRWVPAMDLVETPDEFVVRADLPGLSESDVSIEVEGNALTVSGERAPAHEQGEDGYYRLERATGAFERSLMLPEGVDAKRIAASFDRGVLEVRIPKPEQSKPRKVAIAAGGEPTTIEGRSSTER